MSHGVDAAILSMGYLPEAFEAYPEGVAAGIRLTYAVEPEPLDTAGAVRFAASSAGSTTPSSWSTATCLPIST